MILTTCSAVALVGLGAACGCCACAHNGSATIARMATAGFRFMSNSAVLGRTVDSQPANEYHASYNVRIKRRCLGAKTKTDRRGEWGAHAATVKKTPAFGREGSGLEISARRQSAAAASPPVFLRASSARRSY